MFIPSTDILIHFTNNSYVSTRNACNQDKPQYCYSSKHINGNGTNVSMNHIFLAEDHRVLEPSAPDLKQHFFTLGLLLAPTIKFVVYKT